jgi:hypothetical protein
MPRRRGRRWVAEGYDRGTKRKRYLGTFDTQREARKAEAEWRLRSSATSRETCDQFAARWTTDYPRPRASTNRHNDERVQRFAADFKGLRLADVDSVGTRVGAPAALSPGRGACNVC